MSRSLAEDSCAPSRVEWAARREARSDERVAYCDSSEEWVFCRAEWADWRSVWLDWRAAREEEASPDEDVA